MSFDPAEVNREAASMVTAAIIDYLEDRRVGDSSVLGLNGVDQLIHGAGGRLPAVTGSLVGFTAALVMLTARDRGTDPLQLWQGFLLRAEQRRGV